MNYNTKELTIRSRQLAPCRALAAHLRRWAKCTDG